MPRLINLDLGTVVSCGDDLAALYLAKGWADADALAQGDESTPDEIEDSADDADDASEDNAEDAGTEQVNTATDAPVAPKRGRPRKAK